jgi:hypothetical protein
MQANEEFAATIPEVPQRPAQISLSKQARRMIFACFPVSRDSFFF